MENLYVLLTVNQNLMIAFLYQLDEKILYIIHLIYSFICFEHYCAHLQEDNCISTASDIVMRTIVLVQNLVSSGGQLY